MFKIHPRRTAAFRTPPASYTPMGDVVSSCVFDLEATIAASYGGSGTTWANIEPTPADGSAQTAYDFYTGDGATSTTYPTFNGSAGDEAAYWSFDGGDYFSLKSGANTDFLRDMHKTTGGSDFWIAYVGQHISAQSNLCLSTQSGATGAGISSLEQTAGNWSLAQRGGATTGRGSVEANFQDGFDHLFVVSHSHSGNNTRVWINGTEQGGAHTFSTSTTDASQVATIGSRFNNTVFSPSGVRIYAMSCGNSYIDNAQEALIRAEYETRHQRSYTRDQTTLADHVSSIGLVAEYNACKYASAWGANPDMNNIVPSPADGSATAAYHLPDVSAPPFNNFGSGAPFWNPNANDYWQIAANTQFLKDLHKTTGGADFWIILVINSDGAFGNLCMYSTCPATGAGSDGILAVSTANENLIVRQNGTSAAVSDTVLGTGTFVADDFIVGISYSHSNNNYRIWLNSSTSASTSRTFATSVLDATGLFTVNAESDGGLSTNDINYYMFIVGNTYLADADMANIITYIKGAGSNGTLAGI